MVFVDYANPISGFLDVWGDFRSSAESLWTLSRLSLDSVSGLSLPAAGCTESRLPGLGLLTRSFAESLRTRLCPSFEDTKE
jgi:hypothetical protein